MFACEHRIAARLDPCLTGQRQQRLERLRIDFLLGEINRQILKTPCEPVKSGPHPRQTALADAALTAGPNVTSDLQYPEYSSPNPRLRVHVFQ